MILEIVKGEDQPILNTVCNEVADFDKLLKKLVENMKETMHDAKGIGIAAPQVNVNARIFIATLGFNTDNSIDIAFVNPTITFFSDQKDIAEEGCLSLPGKFGKVERSTSIVIEYFDIKGEKKSLNLSGLDARVVQHEFDHINGVLFTTKLV